jgi:hypothetical protein
MYGEKLKEYLDDGCTVENAMIENADISTSDFPTVSVTLKLQCGGVVFGGVSFGEDAIAADGGTYINGWEHGMTAIFRIMQVAGVCDWDSLVGRPVRAVMKGNMIQAIGHFMDDIFLDYHKPIWGTSNKG